MSDKKPKPDGFDLPTRIGGAILLIWVIGAILSHFFEAPKSPNAFPGSAQYNPQQAEMIWRGMKGQSEDADRQGDHSRAERIRQDCERTTGLSC